MVREKVMVIEDEADILEVIEYNLLREGFRVCSARDGEEGALLVRKEKPDLVLLDLMLPGLNGIEVCRKLKGDPLTHHIPVIIVTAKGEESDIVLGLGIGADDYITKPFSPKELLARVMAVLRRRSFKKEPVAEERIVRDGLVIDPERHEVKVKGKPVSFTATEFRLLHFLASYPGRVYTRDNLLDKVIGEGTFVLGRNIDVHMRTVRKKLGPYKDLIETIRGVGYRFREEEN